VTTIRTLVSLRLRRLFLLMAAISFLAASLGILPTATAYADNRYYVYDDSLHWDNWSWNTGVDPNSSSPVQSGSRSLAVTFNRAWAALSLHTGGFSTGAYNSLQFAVRSSNGGIPKVNVGLYDSNGQVTRQVDMGQYDSAISNGWYWVTIPLSDLGGSNRTITRVQLQEAAGGSQSTFYVDQLQFVGTSTTTSTSSTTQYAPAPSGTYPTGSFKPSQASTQVDNAIRSAVAKYNLPRWFYYAMIQRESSFNPNADNGRDKGLTQLGGAWYVGELYPEWLDYPDDNHRQYGYDMNFQKYGKWILMSKVSRMSTPFDPTQNLDRFSSGYAVQAFKLFKQWYGRSDNETLRMVAFHWNKGMFTSYDPNNYDYLNLYDKHVGQFKPTVERQDGVWNGRPLVP